MKSLSPPTERNELIKIPIGPNALVDSLKAAIETIKVAFETLEGRFEII